MSFSRALNACVAIFALVAVSPVLAQDALEVSGGNVSFGTVTLRSPRERPRLPVTLRNISDQERPIEHISVGCGCIAVDEFEPFRLAPGASREVYLTLDPLKATVGHVKYPMTIHGDGKLLLETHIEYRFEPAVLPVPRIIWLTEAAGGDGVSLAAIAELHLRDTTAADLIARATSPHLIAKIEPTETASRARLIVRAAETQPVGAIEAFVELAPRDDVESGSILVEVRGRVAHPIEVSPKVVLFKPIPKGSTAARTIELRHTSQVPVKVASVDSDAGEQLELKAQTLEDGTARVTITAAGDSARPQNATITINVVGVDTPIVIPVSWRAAA